MFEKRLKEIQDRKAAIRAEIETADEARMAELETEVGKLEAEEVQLRARRDLTGRLGAPIGMPEDRGGASDDQETRAKGLRETRSVTISGGTLVQPQMTGAINPMMNQVSRLWTW